MIAGNPPSRQSVIHIIAGLTPEAVYIQLELSTASGNVTPQHQPRDSPLLFGAIPQRFPT